MTIRIVTGYVPIPNHPRTAAEYGTLGEPLGTLPFPIKAFYNRVQNCWLYKEVHKSNKTLTHSEGDNPQKNSLAYHIVQHQKFEWLGAATAIDNEADTFVWLDYGILHQPGVTVAVIEKFLKRVWIDPVDDVVTIPGCWPVNYSFFKDDQPNWRFCGSLFVVPRHLVKPLALEMRKVTLKGIENTDNVTWEINDLSRLERKGKVPIRWYQADHNQSMFDNYPGGL
jgi:hypothetical protein